ncbi:hypothetical protein ACHJH3_06610 [Campylobacter sp. MOP7]|uniref:hypothetical protein n=1 Tax=Campylobacter canis TaxID=3378588 RepID=UPI00387E5B10
MITPKDYIEIITLLIQNDFCMRQHKEIPRFISFYIKANEKRAVKAYKKYIKKDKLYCFDNAIKKATAKTIQKILQKEFLIPKRKISVFYEDGKIYCNNEILYGYMGLEIDITKTLIRMVEESFLKEHQYSEYTIKTISACLTKNYKTTKNILKDLNFYEKEYGSARFEKSYLYANEEERKAFKNKCINLVKKDEPELMQKYIDEIKGFYLE